MDEFVLDEVAGSVGLLSGERATHCAASAFYMNTAVAITIAVRVVFALVGHDELVSEFPIVSNHILDGGRSCAVDRGIGNASQVERFTTFNTRSASATVMVTADVA